MHHQSSSLTRAQRTVFVIFTVSIAVIFLCLLFLYAPTKQRSKLRPIKQDFIIHYIKLYNYRNGSESHFDHSKSDAYYLECLSLLSVMVNIEFDWIYVHTNNVSYWPFSNCLNFPISWEKVKLVYTPLQWTYQGTKIQRIEHIADIKKLEAILKYGGIAIDFDVFMINGTRTKEILKTFECIVSHETGDKLNAGFLACHPNATFPRKVLDAYRDDFQPTKWVYNSGEKPMDIFRENPCGIYLDDTVDNYPNWDERRKFWERKGVYAWKNKLAYHSFFHNRTYSEKDLKESDSTFGEIMRSIVDKGPTIKSAPTVPIRTQSPTTSTERLNAGIFVHLFDWVM